MPFINKGNIYTYIIVTYCIIYILIGVVFSLASISKKVMVLDK